MYSLGTNHHIIISKSSEIHNLFILYTTVLSNPLELGLNNLGHNDICLIVESS